MTCKISKNSNLSMSNINVCSWNCNGALINKKVTIENFLIKNKIDILMINETKLIAKDKFKMKNYAVLRADRNNITRAGGVIVLIHESIPFTKCKPLIIRKLETISFKIDKTIITAAYNLPDNNFTDNDLDLIFAQGANVWLMGDLNSRYTIWNNSYNNPNGRTLKNYIDNNTLHISYTSAPTHYPANGQSPGIVDLLIKN